MNTIKSPMFSRKIQSDLSSISAPKFGALVYKNTSSNDNSDQNLIDYLGTDADIITVDMGQIEEEERPFMIIDKDTGRVYDTRNEHHIDRLTIGNATNIGVTGILKRDTEPLQASQ